MFFNVLWFFSYQWMFLCGDMPCSNFADIFDVDWFVSFLSKDVKVIKELPRKGGKVIGNPYSMRVPRKCTPRCYQTRVMPALLKKHVSIESLVILKTGSHYAYYILESKFQLLSIFFWFCRFLNWHMNRKFLFNAFSYLWKVLFCSAVPSSCMIISLVAQIGPNSKNNLAYVVNNST